MYGYCTKSRIPLSVVLQHETIGSKTRLKLGKKKGKKKEKYGRGLFYKRSRSTLHFFFGKQILTLLNNVQEEATNA